MYCFLLFSKEAHAPPLLIYLHLYVQCNICIIVNWFCSRISQWLTALTFELVEMRLIVTHLRHWHHMRRVFSFSRSHSEREAIATHSLRDGVFTDLFEHHFERRLRHDRRGIRQQITGIGRGGPDQGGRGRGS